MVTKYIPSTTNAILVGDKGANGATPKPTKVGTNLCSAIMEHQSTTRAALDVRMTTAQLAAIPYKVNGMRAFNTDLQTLTVYAGGNWIPINPIANTLVATGALTAAQIIAGMSSVPITLIAAPGAHQSIIVKGFSLEYVAGAAFVGGGNIILQYTATAAGLGLQVATPIPSAFFTAAAVTRSTFVQGSYLVAPVASYVNTPICISNLAADFTVGTAATVNWTIWYSLITTTG